MAILPGSDRTAANPWSEIVLATGMGELRNGLIVRAADVVIAVGGAYGTLSEIALALSAGTPVIGFDTWAIDGLQTASGPEEAVPPGARAGCFTLTPARSWPWGQP